MNCFLQKPAVMWLHEISATVHTVPLSDPAWGQWRVDVSVHAFLPICSSVCWKHTLEIVISHAIFVKTRTEYSVWDKCRAVIYVFFYLKLTVFEKGLKEDSKAPSFFFIIFPHAKLSFKFRLLKIQCTLSYWLLCDAIMMRLSLFFCPHSL